MSKFKNPWAKGGEYYPEGVVADRWPKTDGLQNDTDSAFKLFNRKISPARYNQFLIEGNNILRFIRFGNPVGDRPGKTDGDEIFDDRYWIEAQSDSNKWGDLFLLPNFSPSEAVMALFTQSNFDRWALDCARYVNALHMYASLKTFRMKRFNKLYEQKSFHFSPHDSTPVKVLQDVFRFGKNNKTYFTGNPKNYYSLKVYKTTERELVVNSPIGNVLIFTNDDANLGSPWRNENTLKIGQNKYIAHGFGTNNIFTELEIRQKLALANNPTLTGAELNNYVKNFIYLKESLWINFYPK